MYDGKIGFFVENVLGGYCFSFKATLAFVIRDENRKFTSGFFYAKAALQGTVRLD
jgi:hypothetical protein